MKTATFSIAHAIYWFQTYMYIYTHIYIFFFTFASFKNVEMHKYKFDNWPEWIKILNWDLKISCSTMCQLKKKCSSMFCHCNWNEHLINDYFLLMNCGLYSKTDSQMNAESNNQCLIAVIFFYLTFKNNWMCETSEIISVACSLKHVNKITQHTTCLLQNISQKSIPFLSSM